MRTQSSVKISDRDACKRFAKSVGIRFDTAQFEDQIYILERREDSDNPDYFRPLTHSLIGLLTLLLLLAMTSPVVVLISGVDAMTTEQTTYGRTWQLPDLYAQ